MRTPALIAIALVIAATADAAEPWVAVHGGWQDARPDDLKSAAAVGDLPWWPAPGDGTLETAKVFGAAIGLRTGCWDLGLRYDHLDLARVAAPFTTQHTSGEGALDLAAHAWLVTAACLPWRSGRLSAGLGAGVGVVVPDGTAGAAFASPHRDFDWQAATTGSAPLLQLTVELRLDLSPTFLALSAGYRRARTGDALVLPAGAALPGGGELPAGAGLPLDLSSAGIVLGLGLRGR